MEKEDVEAGMLEDVEKVEPVEPDLGLEFIGGEDGLEVGGVAAGLGFAGEPQVVQLGGVLAFRSAERPIAGEGIVGGGDG